MPPFASSFLLAGVFELRPARRDRRPVRPPKEAKMLGNSSSAKGPKMTSQLKTVQAAITINPQALNRAHHSRSSSTMRVLALDNPIKKVTASRKMSRKTGTAKQTYHSVFHAAQEVVIQLKERSAGLLEYPMTGEVKAGCSSAQKKRPLMMPAKSSAANSMTLISRHLRRITMEAISQASNVNEVPKNKKARMCVPPSP